MSIEKYGVQAVKAIPLLEQIVSTDPVPEIKVEAGWVLKSISGKIQAIKMPTVNKESIYSRRFHINSEGKLKSIIFPQVFEQTGGFISAKTENSVLVITDERKPPKSQLYAIAMYGKENHQTICFKTKPKVHQYFITDKDYIVFPEGTTKTSSNGPFATIEVWVKDGTDLNKSGAEVALSRGKDRITKITDPNGITDFQLDTVKKENITFEVAPAKGKPSTWKGSVTTYMRGADPNTLVYLVDVMLKD